MSDCSSHESRQRRRAARRLDENEEDVELRHAVFSGGITNIRDVIAFPKTQSGADAMCGAPSPIDEKQLREANIRVVQPPTKAPEPDVHGTVHKHEGGAGKP